VACALSAVGLDSEALINLADSIALNREIAGLHYPSDSEAGTELAAQIWPLLIKSPELASGDAGKSQARMEEGVNES